MQRGQRRVELRPRARQRPAQCVLKPLAGKGRIRRKRLGRHAHHVTVGKAPPRPVVRRRVDQHAHGRERRDVVGRRRAPAAAAGGHRQAVQGWALEKA